jgi:hypothetical protein
MEKAKELLLATGKLALKVTPRARNEGIEGPNAAGELVVKVRAVAEDGKANEAVIALLAKAFGIPKSRLEIARGGTNRHKVIALRP